MRSKLQRMSISKPKYESENIVKYLSVFLNKNPHLFIFKLRHLILVSVFSFMFSFPKLFPILRYVTYMKHLRSHEFTSWKMGEKNVLHS